LFPQHFLTFYDLTFRYLTFYDAVAGPVCPARQAGTIIKNTIDSDRQMYANSGERGSQQSNEKSFDRNQ